MPRKHIYKSKEIYSRRATAWAWAYEMRGVARTLPINVDSVLRQIALFVPEPEMEVDGYLYTPMDVKQGQSKAVDALGLRNMMWGKDLMCRWYWTETHWMEFVKLYESLPDPVEDHYLYYDRERDGGLLVPLGVDKPVDKSGTSREQLARFTYKYADLSGRLVVSV